MSVQQLVIGNSAESSDVITSELLGINSLFTKDTVIDGGHYDTFVDQMGTTSFRFPGGTVTEKLFEIGGDTYNQFWSLSKPDGVTDDIVTAREFVAYAASKDATVDWVLPTENFFSTRTDSNGNRLVNGNAIDQMLDRIEALVNGEYGEINLDTITIGNEYWVKHGERSTPGEYGKMVDYMAPRLQEIFDNYRATLDDPDAWDEPKIAMQTALPWDKSDISKIIAEMDMDTRAVIDVVETHYYERDYDNILSSDSTFARLDDIAKAPGFGKLEYYVSEWNVLNRDDSEHGMEHAADIVEMFETMAEHGVDQASVWGTTYKSLYSRLGRVYNDSDAPGGEASELTAAGEVFRMMALSLEGTQVLDVDIPAHFTSGIGDANATGQLQVNAFGSDQKVVIFLSSRSADGIDLNLDTDDLVGHYDHLWVQQLSTIDNPSSVNLDEGDPLSYLARPYVETAMGNEVTDASGNIHLSLDGYDIVKLEFTIGTGVHMYGNDALVDANADYDDRFVGTEYADTIEGNLGDDELIGNGGRDMIYGGDGDDTINGGDGADTLVTGDGSDTVFTGRGEDTVFALEGENTVHIEEGIAHLYIDTQGTTVINGFDAEAGDTLSFMGAYETEGDLMRSAVVVGDDLAFLHSDGGQTLLKGAGDQLESLHNSLVDFTDPENTAETIARVEDMRADDRLADILTDGTPPEIEEFLGSLSPEDLVDLVDATDLDAIMDQIPAENLPVFLNALGTEGEDVFFENVKGLSLLEHLAQIGDAANDMLAAFDGDVLEGYLTRLVDAFPLPDGLSLSDGVKSDLAGYYSNPAVQIDGTDPIPFLGGEEDDDIPASGSDDDEAAMTGSGGSCFVATAVYGDKFHPDVAYLRKVRDHVLVHYLVGRMFIWVYWRVGPMLAKCVGPCPVGRRMARNTLALVIRMMRNSDLVARHDHGFRSSFYLRMRNQRR